MDRFPFKLGDHLLQFGEVYREVKILRPLKFTCIGVGLSVLGAICLATFEPLDGRNPLDFLFPLLRPVVALTGVKDVPAFLFYALVPLHWPILGAVVDAVRWMRRERASRRVSA